MMCARTLRETLGRWALPVLLLIAVMLTGCVEERVVKSAWDNLEEVADAKPGEEADRDPNAPRMYAVELRRFTGDDALSQAYNFARQVREQTQLADVWFSSRGDYTAVYTGRYRTPDAKDAKAKLSKVRDASFGGSRAFRDAELVPVERSRSSGDPYDLAQYTGYRSLLVVIYDREFGPEFRRAAERTAEDYRKEHEGTTFYYYHGPSQSVVTAGLFTEFDFEMVNNVESYGPGIKALQETFPHTLLNGKPIENPEVPGEDKREPTIIIRVP